jgi:hypothetical protein
LKKSKDVGLMNDLVEYYSFFQPYELQNIKFLIKDDVANANSLRELQRIKKRLERELYVDIKK